MDDRRYWAFLSYSHRDAGAAGRLHRMLETFRVPPRLVGRPTALGPAPRRFAPVFRDREELAADAYLRERLRDALERSRFLIVLCSPAAAASPWVEQEIVQFKVLHGADRVLAVIVDGEPRASEQPGREAEECFPAALRVRVDADGRLTDERADPIAADLRPGQDGARLGLLKLIARMLEVGLDELIQRDAHRRQVLFATVAGISAAVALGMGGLALAALAARNEAIAARDEARVQRGQAEGLVEFMVGDLQEKLEPKVRLDVLGSVADRAMAYYAVQTHHAMDEDALGRRSRVLTMLGWIEQDRGQTEKAEALLEQAAESARRLVARDPKNPQRLFELARIQEHLGNIALQRGRLPAAESRFRDAVRLTDAAVARGGPKAEWLTEQASAHTDLGVALLKEDHPAEAVSLLRGAVALQEAVERRAPGDRQRRYELTQDIAWRADAERATGDVEAALRDRVYEDAISLQLLQANPDDREARRTLAVSRIAQSQMLLGDGRAARAITLARQAAVDSEAVLAGDPGDTYWLISAVAASKSVAEAALAMNDPAVAKPAADRALVLAGNLARTDPSVEDWSVRWLGGARLLSARVAARRATGLETCLSALGPAVAESQRLDRVAAAEPVVGSMSLTIAEGDMLRGDHNYLAGSLREAASDWAAARKSLASAGSTLRGRTDPLHDDLPVELAARERLIAGAKRETLPRRLSCS